VPGAGRCVARLNGTHALYESKEHLMTAINKILIVDDSPTEALFMSDLLGKRGFKVAVASNSEQAFARLQAESFDLILMDVVMPGQNGYQATRAIKRDDRFKDIPVIMCTSKGLDTDRIWGMRQGASDYIVKPVDGEELLGKIAALAH
jgi:twitching motility two-component system response regulator PilH